MIITQDAGRFKSLRHLRFVRLLQNPCARVTIEAVSKKTEQIYKSIASLEDLRNQISIIVSLRKSSGGDFSESERSGETRHLESIEFEMTQQLKSLRFWIGSLYSFNGKSTSRAKQNASKENGRKGGRPPKEITRMRRRAGEIEGLLDEARRERVLTTDFEAEARLDSEIADFEAELADIKEKLDEWRERRGK